MPEYVLAQEDIQQSSNSKAPASAIGMRLPLAQSFIVVHSDIVSSEGFFSGKFSCAGLHLNP